MEKARARMARQAKVDRRTKESQARGSGRRNHHQDITHNRRQDIATNAVAQVIWQQTAQRKFTATEHATTADNKVTSPQTVQVRVKEVDTKEANINRVGIARYHGKGKENPQAKHHDSKDTAIIVGNTATSVRTASNFSG